MAGELLERFTKITIWMFVSLTHNLGYLKAVSLACDQARVVPELKSDLKNTFKWYWKWLVEFSNGKM